MNPVLQFKRLHPAAKVPAYQSGHAAGMDLCACPHDGLPLTLNPGDIRVIPCGFAMAIPHGFEGQVRPRSGLATKHGISMPNTPGTVDSDYRGEMMVPLVNLSRQPFVVEPGMRVAQLVIAPVARAMVIEVDALDETGRGSGGFGSTGVHS